jgi:hypothetical protein
MRRATRAALLFFVLGFCSCLLLVGLVRFLSHIDWGRFSQYEIKDNTPAAFYPVGKCPDCHKISCQYWKIDKLNDDNNVHLKAARKLGIEPCQSNAEFESRKEFLVSIHQLQELVNTRTYRLKNLTHSYPYVVPKAVVLLNEIGDRFEAKLERLEIKPHLMQISSVLRTLESQNGLGKRNGNAVPYSAHMYGTTFDLSYKEFIPENGKPAKEGFCRHDLMRHVLAEVLTEMRHEGRCKVVIEKRQACFHVTVCK